MTEVFRVRNLKFRRLNSDADFLLNVEKLDISHGEIVAFVGPSGCGKSTLIDILAFLLYHDGAADFHFSPILGGENFNMSNPDGQKSNFKSELRKNFIGYVPQVGGLVPSLTTFQNIELSCRLAGRMDRANIEDLICRLNITTCRNKRPEELSVGERQRVAIARALSHRPPVIIADEPTAALDPHNSNQVMDLFIDLVRSVGSTLLLVSHDRDLIAKLGIDEVSLNVTKKGPNIISHVSRTIGNA